MLRSHATAIAWCTPMPFIWLSLSSRLAKRSRASATRGARLQACGGCRLPALAEPQIGARQLTDGSAAHQFHIAFDLSPHEPERSEERRVGKECRSRRSADR